MTTKLTLIGVEKALKNGRIKVLDMHVFKFDRCRNNWPCIIDRI